MARIAYYQLSLAVIIVAMDFALFSQLDILANIGLTAVLLLVARRFVQRKT